MTVYYKYRVQLRYWATCRWMSFIWTCFFLEIVKAFPSLKRRPELVILLRSQIMWKNRLIVFSRMKSFKTVSSYFTCDWKNWYDLYLLAWKIIVHIFLYRELISIERVCQSESKIKLIVSFVSNYKIRRKRQNASILRN